MGRRRKPENHFLPERVYRHDSGVYYYSPKNGRAIRLGTEAEKWQEAWEHVKKDIVEFRPGSYAKQLYRVAKRSASSRKLTFSLTLQDVLQMLERSDYRCAVTGVPFFTKRVEGARVRPWIPSIDRIRNSEGYAPGNCRVVCAFVNIAMNTFGIDTFRHAALHLLRHERRR